MNSSFTSSLEATLAQVGDRWSLLIADALLEGPARFNELQAAIPGIATNILTQRLKNLETERVVIAVPYSERPVRYAYELTETGRGLAGAIHLLAQWGAQHGDVDDVPRHHLCGSVLEARWYCPTCDTTVERDEVSSDNYL